MSPVLPVTFVVHRQEVHQEHVVCHGIHPKYFHLESWKHSPGKEEKNTRLVLKRGSKWLLLLYVCRDRVLVLFLCPTLKKKSAWIICVFDCLN